MPVALKTVHLTEISVSEYPQAQNFKYKCKLSLISHGQPKLEKSLLTRMQPNWLMDVKHQGDCKIAITPCYREGDITNPWQDIETVEFATDVDAANYSLFGRIRSQ